MKAKFDSSCTSCGEQIKSRKEIAKDTMNETYYWIGKRKVDAVKSMGEKMSKVLERQQSGGKTGLDAYF